MPSPTYTKIDDIQAYYQSFKFTANSLVTTRDVENFIVEQEAILDSILGKYYVVPITNTTDLLIIKNIVDKSVVHVIDGIIRKTDTEGKYVFSRNLGKEANSLLERIEKGDIKLNTTRRNSVMKFNNLDADGTEQTKHFKMKNADPTTLEH